MQLRIRLDLTSEHRQRHLLAGLDSWVKLGLLSDAQIRELAYELSEPILTQPAAQPAPITDFVAATAESMARPEPSPAAPSHSWLSRALRSLLDEISVIWLLFLGVFLVIVSSGVLAASQWETFPPVGQYAILFTYTVAFWGASVWAQRQAHLQTTARMLALTAMLLIPVNVWMMDALGVLSRPLGLGIGGLAAAVLTGLPFQPLTHRSNQLNLIGLSWLHWGWGWGSWPLLAIYLGTIGTAANLTYQDRQSALVEGADPNQIDAEQPDARSRVLSFDRLIMALAILILLVRGLLVIQLPPHQLGLAAGICGWLLVWLTRRQAAQIVWGRVGAGLLVAGWAISAGHEPPWQAIGVSGLALWLLGDQLRQTWQRDRLLMVLGVALQAYYLLWFTIPTTVRSRLLADLSDLFSTQSIQSSEWASLGLFPFLIGLLLFAKRLQHWQQPRLALTTEQAALVLGIGLALLGITNRFSAVANLSLSAVTLGVMLRSRPQVSAALVALTHGTGLLALAAGVNYVAPELSAVQWTYLILGSAIAEFLAHLIVRPQPWQRSTWQAGLGLSALSYGLLLWHWGEHPSWVWLLVPVALTLVANHQRALHPRAAVGFTMVALLLQGAWLTNWPIAIASFAVGTVCMGFNSRVWRTDLVALFTVGSSLALVNSSLWYGLIAEQETVWGRLLIVLAIEIWALWLLQRGLMRRSGELAALYARATQFWGLGLMVGLMLWSTLVAAVTLLAPTDILVRYQTYIGYVLAAAILLIAALLEAIRTEPAEWRYCSLAWVAEVALILGLTLRGVGYEGVAIATFALGLVSQLVADIWVRRHPPYRTSWHGIPIAYALLGVLLGHVAFQAETGLYTLAAAALFAGVGRRQTSLHPFAYLGLAMLSIGAYELLIYRLLQASGGRPGDGVTLLAGLALLIALLERCFSAWLLRYLQISPDGLRGVAHTHWLVGSLLAVGAAIQGLGQPYGLAIWTVTSLLLAGYALSIGNYRWTSQPLIFTSSVWTTLGLLEALFCVAYIRFIWFADQTGLLTWGGVIACAIGLAFYLAPWQRWGWPVRPWRQLGLWLPMLTLSITLDQVQTQGLLLIGAFYAGMAKQFEQIRLSYLSILLFDWALLRYLSQQGWLTALWLGLILGLSALYVVEVEPELQPPTKRQQRHWLRSLASGLVGLTALFQAEVSDPMLIFAGLTLLLAMGFVFVGLILKVRAFLYVGTGLFIVQVIRVLWLSISTNSLLLWAIGILLGLVLIWVAATSESRRAQVTTLLESWASALEAWD